MSSVCDGRLAHRNPPIDHLREVTMANYLVYGFAAYEVEVHNHIKQKVIFAISMAHRPHWLSWYMYTQDMAAVWAQDYTHHKADRVALIGEVSNGIPSTAFSYSAYVNVNAFAGKNYSAAAVLTMDDKGPLLIAEFTFLRRLHT
jgi:hypothetical protein